MTLDSALTLPKHDSIFGESLTLDEVRKRAPAAFAEGAHESCSERYTFIPTEKVLAGLINVGFVVVQARQAGTRSLSTLHARHVIRLRRRFESVQLNDAVPEVIFMNSHDGTSAYQLRMAIYRAICTNGLIVSRAAFQTVCVAHRGNIVDEVIEGALQMAERFPELAAEVERMEQKRLTSDQQHGLACKALAIRYPDTGAIAMNPVELLNCRRLEDSGDDLWRVFNRVQENLICGGLSRKLGDGRVRYSRRITSIREDVRINNSLWDLAREVLAT